jgi:hypothetical protein
VNTPQFDWVLSRLPRRPQPVPPIYQPEIAAEAVYWAAHHRRRELWVGYSTVQAIVGGFLAPRLADFYLARTGFKGQQVEGMPVEGVREGNLFEPQPGLAATHGMFDSEAKSASPELRVATHRRALGAAAAVGAGAVATALALGTRNGSRNGRARAAGQGGRRLRIRS